MNFIEVHNKATGRNEMIPEDWLDSPVLNTDANGDLLERVMPVPAEVATERPTAKSTHAEIDAFAESVGVSFPEDAKTREEKVAVLDELAPAASPPDGTPAPNFPDAEPGVELTGPVSNESTIPAFQNTTNETPAGDEEN